MTHFFKQPGLISPLAHLLIVSSYLCFQLLLFMRNLSFSKFFLRVPVVFEHFKLVNAHMHENFN